MKRKLLFFLSFFALVSYGQSPINSFYVDDNAVFAVVTSGVELDQTASGANLIWNFDQLLQYGTSFYTKTLPTPAEITAFPNTNNVVLSTFNTPDTSTSQMFVKDLSSVISITGLRAAGLELKFNTNNATLGAFPMNYGYTNTDQVAGNYLYDTFSGTFSGNIVTSVDAYGTLNRNVGSVLSTTATRLKTVITLSLNYGFFTNVGTITQTTYSYYQNPAVSADGLLFRSSTTAALVPLASIDQTDVALESYVATLLDTDEISFIENQIQIASNPVRDFLSFRSTADLKILSTTIVDSSGRIVLSIQSNTNSIDMSKLTTGIYCVKIATNKGTVTKKIIKE